MFGATSHICTQYCLYSKDNNEHAHEKADEIYNKPTLCGGDNHVRRRQRKSKYNAELIDSRAVHMRINHGKIYCDSQQEDQTV